MPVCAKSRGVLRTFVGTSPLARCDSREEIERMVASYDDARRIVGKAAARKMREMFVPAAKHQPRPSHGPEIKR
jgi:hypothetical protein